MSITKEQALEKSTVAGTPTQLFAKFENKVLEAATMYAKQRSQDHEAKYKLALVDLVNLASSCTIEGVLEEKSARVLSCKVDNFQLLNGSVNTMLGVVLKQMAKTPLDKDMPLSVSELAKLVARPDLCMAVEIPTETPVVEATTMAPEPLTELSQPSVDIPDTITPPTVEVVPQALPEPPVVPHTVPAQPAPVVISLVDDTTMVVDKSTGRVDFQDVAGENVGSGFIPQDAKKSWKDNVMDWLGQIWSGIQGVVASVVLGFLAVSASVGAASAGVVVSLWKMVKAPYAAYKMKDLPKGTK